MIFDYITGSANELAFPIYGHLIPVNTLGVALMMAAILPAVATVFLQFRISRRATEVLLWLSVITAFLGGYVASCRWLDDLFVNLAHSYNLFHHGRFSVSASHMVNGTVEILYYLLLTPFAETRTSLIVANYCVGFLIGLSHLYVLSLLLRPYAIGPRLICLLGYSITIPLVQTFAGGYGNSLVSLVFFVGMYGIIKNQQKTIYVCCALLSALRPDAILYSFAIILADLIANKRLKPIFWLPTAASVALYFLSVRAMYGYWIPTPLMLKGLSVQQLLLYMPSLKWSLPDYFTTNLFHACYGVLALLFFLIPDIKGTVLTKRSAAAWLVATIPIFLFYAVSSYYGYNPTSQRYYVAFEVMLTVLGLMAVTKVLQLVSGSPMPSESPATIEQPEDRPSSNRLQSSRMGRLVTTVATAVIASGLLFVVANQTSLSLAVDDGKSIGIQMGSWDIERLSTLALAGRYTASVVPPTWRVASTELDTFGLFSDREILDLWGYSNREIAESKVKNRFGIKCNPHTFLDSNVEVFWVRTVPLEANVGGGYTMTEPDPQLFAGALTNLPNLSKYFDQAGDLNLVFQKYDVFRISHAGILLTVYLIRKDLTPQFREILMRSGHRALRAETFNMGLMRQVYARQPSPSLRP